VRKSGGPIWEANGAKKGSVTIKGVENGLKMLAEPNPNDPNDRI
jgi:hypothetical protein